jgi:hypothetical protein
MPTAVRHAPLSPATRAIVLSHLCDEYQKQIEALIARYPAQEQNRRFYIGRIAGAEIVRMRRTVRTKLGVAFSTDDLALAFPSPGGSYRTLWSSRNETSTSVCRSAFVVVG